MQVPSGHQSVNEKYYNVNKNGYRRMDHTSSAERTKARQSSNARFK